MASFPLCSELHFWSYARHSCIDPPCTTSSEAKGPCRTASLSHIWLEPSKYPYAMSTQEAVSCRNPSPDAPFQPHPRVLSLLLPGSSTPIDVPIDESLGSKKADNKRQLNALASSRHRKKKKLFEQETTRQLQDMASRVEELRAERDYYREQLRALRHEVHQPSSSSIGGSFEDVRNQKIPSPTDSYPLGPGGQQIFSSGV